jgi:hypothetical protein
MYSYLLMMPDQQHVRLGGFRLVLLLAGVMYVLSAVSEPVLHAWPYGGEGSEQISVGMVGEDSDIPSPSGSHDGVCSLCLVATSASLPLTTDEVWTERTVTDLLLIGAQTERSPPVRFSPRPRGPPSAA